MVCSFSLAMHVLRLNGVQGRVDLFLSDVPLAKVCARAAQAGARHILIKASNYGRRREGVVLVTSSRKICDEVVAVSRRAITPTCISLSWKG